MSVHDPACHLLKNKIALICSYTSAVPGHITMSNKLPPGIILKEDFITPAEEEELLKLMNMEETLEKGWFNRFILFKMAFILMLESLLVWD